MSDIYNKPTLNVARPLTADQLSIVWGGTGTQPLTLMQANNFQVSYSQPVSQRYTLNSAQNFATIYPGRPKGNMTIGRLICENEQNMFTLPGFDVCAPPAIITWANVNTFSEGSCTMAYGSFTARGAWVTSYSFQADADNLIVVDNVSIEFLQLEFDPAPATT